MVCKASNITPVSCLFFLVIFFSSSNICIANDWIKKQAAIDQQKIEAYLTNRNLQTTITESGLHYNIYKQGQGEKPNSYDVVTVHYKGYFLNGTEFHNTYINGESEKFQLNKVIDGWMQGISFLSKGAKAKFIIPSNLAYGAAGRDKDILPNTILIFDVHLIDFYSVQLSKDVAAIEGYIKENNLSMQQTKSGVFYNIEEVGDGWGCADYNTVTLDYKGTLLDGTTFWSTYQGGIPLKIRLDKSLKAFYEILPMLREGGKVTIITPPNMAYGIDGSPPYIEPNAILVYDLELVDVE